MPTYEPITVTGRWDALIGRLWSWEVGFLSEECSPTWFAFLSPPEKILERFQSPRLLYLPTIANNNNSSSSPLLDIFKELEELFELSCLISPKTLREMLLPAGGQLAQKG